MKNIYPIAKQFLDLKQTVTNSVNHFGTKSFEMSSDKATIQFLVRNGSFTAYVWFHTEDLIESYEKTLIHLCNNQRSKKWILGDFEVSKKNSEEGDYFEIIYYEKKSQLSVNHLN